jgi:ATP-dependent Clp protease adaptor protein ClpS
MRLWGGAQMAHTGQCRMGPARMAKPSVAPETEVVERDQMVPLYQVVLLDDDYHTYDYVIEMLQKIFIFTFDQAYRHAEEVDRYSRTVLITCELREAEYARGPDPLVRSRIGACRGRKGRCRR